MATPLPCMRLGSRVRVKSGIVSAFSGETATGSISRLDENGLVRIPAGPLPTPSGNSEYQAGLRHTSGLRQKRSQMQGNAVPVLEDWLVTFKSAAASPPIAEVMQKRFECRFNDPAMSANV
jgi:hypothetical protein